MTNRRGMAVGGAVLVVMALGVALLAPEGGGQPADLNAFPMGVTPSHVGNANVFIVRSPGSVKVFLTTVHHLAGEHSLLWCPKERLFASPTYGELFKPDGRVAAGPASAGLDRLETRLDNGRLVADAQHVIPGSTQHLLRDAYVTIDPKAQAGTWNSGPSSFCHGAVGTAR